MSEDVYVQLRDFLHRLPGGFPTTDSGVELKVLKKLFAPEEAEIAVLLNPAMLEPVAAIAPSLGVDEQQAAKALESMARHGLIRRIHIGDDVFYMALQFVIGIYEENSNRMDRELAELVEEFLIPGTLHSAGW